MTEVSSAEVPETPAENADIPTVEEFEDIIKNDTADADLSDDDEDDEEYDYEDEDEDEDEDY